MRKGAWFTGLGILTGLALVAWYARPGTVAALIPGMSNLPKPPRFAHKLSDDLWQSIQQVAGNIGADPYQLAEVINFESNGFNPQAVNPYSGASGLIQFMPFTAAELGTTVESIRRMGALEQMPLVERYFRMKVGSRPLNTFQSLTMSIFYPKYMDVDPNTQFPANVQASNPGIRTPQDYMNKVLAKS